MRLPHPSSISRRRLILFSIAGALAVGSLVLLLVDFRPPQRAVFIGDSYTHGTGASAPDRRWSSLVAASRGWEEINLGNGGTGYATSAGPKGCGRPTCPSYLGVVAEAASSRPGVVVVAGGQNDFAAYSADPAAVAAAVGQTYAALRAALPKATIIAVGPSTAGGLSPTVHGLDQAVQQAAAASGARYISLIDPTPVVTPDALTADRVHVDDRGHRAIADRVLAGLRR